MVETLRDIAIVLGRSLDELTASGIAAPASEYAVVADPRAAILSNYEAPPGLRDLAMDNALIEALQIAPEEWARLAAVPLPRDVSKQGYMQLLVTLRAIVSV